MVVELCGLGGSGSRYPPAAAGDGGGTLWLRQRLVEASCGGGRLRGVHEQGEQGKREADDGSGGVWSAGPPFFVARTWGVGPGYGGPG